ncbi:cytochrome P450 [Virgisporangium ochraceum]|uniref:Cytochrome P450 n=1 Tax=Virgisporangium ochraceum TaxID=65505 RepID=A0A8J4A5F5_9ACTN|nr:cytochrome P450 [Virgisporangium ochraceum]
MSEAENPISVADGPASATVSSIPAYRALPALARDPLGALVAFGNASRGSVVRIGLGLLRPYLVTNPAHVQHVLRDHSAIYLRDGSGMLWGAVKRLFGEGIMAEGEVWQESRRILQPLFTAKRVDAMVDVMADEIYRAVDEVPAGRVLDASAEMSRIVCRAVVRVLFGDKVSVDDAVRIVAAQDAISASVVARVLAPFVPNSVPMPGDRAFRDNAALIDDILLPAVRRARAQPDGGDDIISTLSRAKTADGRDIDERQIRNDTVSMFASATETSYRLLTFLWPHLKAHPDVAAALYREIDDVVGDATPDRSHLARLTYTRMVLDEMLRLYPIGWLIPRVAAADDVIDGVPIPKGATLLVSPYITQRLDAYWDRPAEFRPDRFAARPAERRHRYTHYPFGGGPHKCIGQHLFYLEAQLIVAAVLSRFRVRVHTPGIPAPRPAASLRSGGKVELTLVPRGAV